MQASLQELHVMARLISYRHFDGDSGFSVTVLYHTLLLGVPLKELVCARWLRKMQLAEPVSICYCFGCKQRLAVYPVNMPIISTCVYCAGTFNELLPVYQEMHLNNYLEIIKMFLSYQPDDQYTIMNILWANNLHRKPNCEILPESHRDLISAEDEQSKGAIIQLPEDSSSLPAAP